MNGLRSQQQVSMVYILSNLRYGVKTFMFELYVEPQPTLQNFEHFDAISIIYKRYIRPNGKYNYVYLMLQ